MTVYIVRITQVKPAKEVNVGTEKEIDEEFNDSGQEFVELN